MTRRSKKHRKVETKTPPRQYGKILICIGIAVALGALVYLNALDNPFVYDDQVTIVENGSLRDINGLRVIFLHDIFRPLTNITYAIDYSNWQLEPRGYHFSSLLLHLLNIILFFLLVRRIFDDVNPEGSFEAPAFIAASLFAIHPMMTEAVGYISGRSEVLCTTWLIVAFLYLRRYLVDSKKRWLMLGFAFFVIAAASKELAAALPFLLLVYDALVLAEAGKKQRLLRFHLPFVGFITLAGILRIFSYLRLETTAELESFSTNLLVEASVVWRYLGLLLAPVHQSVVHDVRPLTSIFDPIAFVSVFGLFALFISLVVIRKRSPVFVFGAIWFFLLLAPSHILPLAEAMAEHRVYAASLGFFLGIAWCFDRVSHLIEAKGLSRIKQAVVILIPMLMLLSWLTVERNRVWASPMSLWADAAERAPRTWVAQYEYGNTLRQDGRCDEAIAPYQRAIQILPSKLEAYWNLGVCFAETGHELEARDIFETALRLDPANAKTLNNIGLLAWRGRRIDEARSNFERSLEVDPGNVHARLLLARMFEGVYRDLPRALELYREIQRIEGPTPEITREIARLESTLRAQ